MARPADPRLHDALEYIKEQISTHVSEIEALMHSANSLARAAGLPAPYPDEGAVRPLRDPLAIERRGAVHAEDDADADDGDEVDAERAPAPKLRGTPPDAAGLAVHKSVHPGQFARHRTPSVAIRAYLDWRGPRGRGVGIDELHRALVEGSFPFEHGGERARAIIRAAVARDPDIVRSRSGLYALSRWTKRR